MDLTKPDHLAPRKAWLRAHAFAVIALVLGAATFVATAVAQPHFWSDSDWRISVPGFAVTVAAAIASLIRRERASAYWLAGLGGAAAALVLGWVLLFVVVIAVTLIAILILHSVL